MPVQRVTIEGENNLGEYADFNLRTSDNKILKLTKCGIIKMQYEGELIDEKGEYQGKAQLCVDADSPDVGTLVTS